VIALGASIYFGFLGFRSLMAQGALGRRMPRQLDHDQADLEDAPVEQPLPHHDLRRLCLLLPGQLWRHLEALFPIHLPGHNLLGDFYRFLADLATMSVLIGVIYFILRRFVFNDKALTYRDNVKLVERVKQGGIRRDSLIVAFFILFHVGFRWIGNSFKLSIEGATRGSPSAARWRTCGWAGRNGRARRRAPGLLAGARPDPGLPALLPLHQALPPDHVGRQLPHQAEAHLAG
jgi:hypothetical protein